MQIFLCWSGDPSLKIAEGLHTFLGDAIQELKPFLSSKDIDKGSRWRNDVSQRLADCNYGILCLTKENLDSRWILFEAGALSKLEIARVTAILAGIQATNVTAPLSQFQHTGTTSDEIFILLSNINKLLPEDKRLDEARLKRAFENNWPALKSKIAEALAMRAADTTPPPVRSVDDMLTEVLELVRGLKRDADSNLPPLTRANRFYNPIPFLGPGIENPYGASWTMNPSTRKRLAAFAQAAPLMQNIAEGGTPSPGGAADTPLALKESTEPQAADAVPPVKKKRTRKRR